MLVMVFNWTFHKTYARGLLGKVPQNRTLEIYFGQIVHPQDNETKKKTPTKKVIKMRYISYHYRTLG